MLNSLTNNRPKSRLKCRLNRSLDSCDNSWIYEGVIRHRRLTPAKNRFKLSAFMFYLDLDEIDDLFGSGIFWSNRRFGYACFQRVDHMKHLPADQNLKDCVKEVLKDNGLDIEIERVCLLTQLRYCGFRMNPVSFYYCFGKSEDRLVAVIAEVNNTPWDEQHIYVIPDHEIDVHASSLPGNEGKTGPTNIVAVSERRTLKSPSKRRQRYVKTEKLNKSFHVSPFMHSDMYYRMVYSLPEQRIAVKMENFEAGEKIFDVSMLMQRKPITKFRLLWLSVKYPVYSLKVFAGIYFQALKLYLKKVPVHPHPNRQSHPGH